jgi:hypothetical protein
MQGWNYGRVQKLGICYKSEDLYNVENHMRLIVNEIKIIWTRKGVGIKEGARKEVKTERKMQQ